MSGDKKARRMVRGTGPYVNNNNNNNDNNNNNNNNNDNNNKREGRAPPTRALAS